MQIRGNMPFEEIFPSHLIHYSVPENFHDKDTDLFYPDNFKENIPAVRLYSLSNVALTNMFVYKGLTVLPSFTSHNPLSLALSMRSLFKRLLLKKRKIGEVILGVQDFANNYFHWMTEVLPHILAMKKNHPNSSVLFPTNYKNYPFIQEACDLLDIPSLSFELKNIIQIEKVSAIPVPHVGRFNEGLMHFYRSQICSKLSLVETTIPHRKIFISRAHAKRRKISNEAELWKMLESHGFEKVYLEDMRLIDQINLFHESKIIVGPHGAGLANILFMQQGQIVVELKANNNDYWCYFSLARVFGLKYYYLLCDGNTTNHRDADIHVDLDAIEELIKSLHSN